MRILAIGTPSNIKKKVFTGQSTMFDGIVKYWKDNGYNVSIVDISSKIGKSRKVGTFSIYRVLDYLISYICFVFKLLFYKIDIVYILTAQSSVGFIRDFLFINTSKLFGKRVISHQYGANYIDFYNSLSDKNQRRLRNMLQKLAYIIVEGDYMKEQFSFLSDYKNKVVVVPNGLPFDVDDTINPKHLESGKSFNIIYLSNMIVSKGYFDVLEAINILLNKRNINVQAVFCGRFIYSHDDPKLEGDTFENDFFKRVKKYQLNDNVKYRTGAYGHEKKQLFDWANCFVLPTYYTSEGQPLSVLEAVSNGCVPIVTKYRHIPMMVSEETGYFVRPQNPEDIADAIEDMIRNTDKYSEMSKNNILKFNESFRFNIFAKKVTEYISRCI